MPTTMKSKRSGSAAKKTTSTKKIRWDLSELYSGRDDPKIDRDLKRLASKGRRFAKRYQGEMSSLDAAGMKSLLREMEAIQLIADQVILFAYLKFTIKSNDSEWSAFLQSCQERITEGMAQTEFVAVEWSRLSDAKARRLLKAPELARYRHFLERARQHKSYMLSVAEEMLATRLDPVGASGWRRYFHSVLSNIEFTHRGKRVTQPELVALMSNEDREIRHDAVVARAKGLDANRKPLTFAFNMLLGAKKLDDELRDYEHWIRRRNIDNEFPDDAVEALVKAVVERTDILRRYLKLKKALLGVDPFMSYDLYAPIPQVKKPKMNYAKSVEMILDTFEKTRPAFGEITRDVLAGRHVDLPPDKGKRGGAYCAPNRKGLPFVFMNWTGEMRDVTTLAHELGHAVHMALSKKHGPLGASRSLVMSEVASVFMETLIAERLFAESKSRRQRLEMLRQIIEAGFVTTYRQIQFHLVESASHERRREQGELSYEDLGRIYVEAERKIYGSIMKSQRGSENFWMAITHFVDRPGYVYAYCASYLVVLALYARYLEVGPSFLAKYEKVLAAGGTQSPQDLLGGLGVDWSRPDFWSKGLEVLGTYVDRFEATAKEMKLI